MTNAQIQQAAIQMEQMVDKPEMVPLEANQVNNSYYYAKNDSIGESSSI